MPEQAGRLARALAILEESELLQTARLADLDEAEAAEAAELLASAGIIESGRPLAFIHPIVRSGIYADLSGIERARGHSGAARLLAEQPGARERVAQHLLLSEPAADHWVVERLVEAACAAGKQGAPEAEAVLLRRALAEPPEASVRPVLLLDLGMAEATAGLPEWPDHLQQAVDAAPTAEAAGLDALVLGLALSRAQRFEEAVVVLDRARTAVGRRRVRPLACARSRRGRRRRSTIPPPQPRSRRAARICSRELLIRRLHPSCWRRPR